MRTFLFLLICLASPSGFAQSLEVSDAWIRSLPPSVPVRSGYLRINNHSDGAIEIIGVESEAFTRIEIHETVEKNGMMTMRPVLPLSIPANTKIELAPGGLHLMMMDPDRMLNPGDEVEIILRLDTGEFKVVIMTVRK